MSRPNSAGAQAEQTLPTFNPTEHLMQIKGRDGIKDYLPVQWRLVWFRSVCPLGTIETEMLHLDLDRVTEEETLVWNAENKCNEQVVKQASGFVVFRAVVKDGKGGIGTGTKSEKASSFPDFIEKAETGAIGRALAALGYGTQFAPELNEEHRIVDAPVERRVPTLETNGRKPLSPMRPAGTAANGNGQATLAIDTDASATEEQLASIRKLSERLGKPEPEQATSLTYLAARELIQQLSHEYNEQRQNRKAS
jgi:hypothetical protein